MIHIFTIGFELVVKPPTRHTSLKFQFYPYKIRHVTTFTTATINMESNQHINHGIKNKYIPFTEGNRPTLIWNQKSHNRPRKSWCSSSPPPLLFLPWWCLLVPYLPFTAASPDGRPTPLCTCQRRHAHHRLPSPTPASLNHVAKTPQRPLDFFAPAISRCLSRSALPPCERWLHVGPTKRRRSSNTLDFGVGSPRLCWPSPLLTWTPLCLSRSVSEWVFVHEKIAIRSNLLSSWKWIWFTHKTIFLSLQFWNLCILIEFSICVMACLLSVISYAGIILIHCTRQWLQFSILLCIVPDCSFAPTNTNSYYEDVLCYIALPYICTNLFHFNSEF
jgi:hypothetical protein